MSGGVGGWRGAIPATRPDQKDQTQISGQAGRPVLRERVLAVLDGFGDFSEHVGAGGDRVFEFDGALDRVLFQLHELQHFLAGSVALSASTVGTILNLAVFDM